MATEHLNGKNPKHLYQRTDSGYWWFTGVVDGRHIRRSTKTLNLQDTIAIRDRWLATAAATKGTSEWKQWVAEQASNPNSWLLRTLSRMRRKSKRRNWASHMSLDEISLLLARCDGKCEITGETLKKPDGKNRDPLHASIDRIDSSRGYVFDNCRVISLAMNIAMSHWGEDVVRRLARRLVAKELSR